MVEPHTKPIAQRDKHSRFIYITGCDGTGKTTQADLIQRQLEKLGLNPLRVWLRFPFMLSIPFLAYARWRGYSWYEQTGMVRHGYWDFHRSRLLRTLLPWTLLIDAALAGLVKIHLPLLQGRTIVCERFVLDMVVDLAAAFGDDSFHHRLPGRLYRWLLPRNAVVVILDLDAETARRRRPDLLVDRRLEIRLELFRQVVADYKLLMLSSRYSIEELGQQVLYITGFIERDQ